MPEIFMKGLWFDLNVAVYFFAFANILRLLLLTLIKKPALIKALRVAYISALIFFLLLVMVCEVVFWNEFSSRFNFISVDYLLYTHEVFENIRQSYSLGLILSGILMTSLIFSVFLHKIAAGNNEKRKAGIGSVFVALFFIFLSMKTANIGQMENTKNEYANELSGNGLFSFFSALNKNELDYDRFYKTMPQNRADDILRKMDVERVSLETLLQEKSYKERSEVFDKVPFSIRPRNVILISVESLSASYLGSLGNKEGLTPNLDKISKQSLVFERFYATGTRTVRGLESLSVGLPPVPGQSIIRRPEHAHLSTLGEILSAQGFETFFIYGGYGYFDNMNEYFKSNNYHVIDRTDFASETIPFENIWGVADEALFHNSFAYFDRASSQSKRFFAHIMTTSNHRPYTYPDGRIDIPSPGGRYGAVKYTDYALGEFLREAEKHSWFNETLFVITADHCSSVAGQTKLPVYDYRIPLIFYAPKILKPGVNSKLVSQIDVPPTLLEALGVAGDDYFFGQSLFEETVHERAFITNYQDLGYYKSGVLTVLLPKGRVVAYRIDQNTFEGTPTEPVESLTSEAVAYYQTAWRSYKDNFLKFKKEPEKTSN